MTIYTGAGDRGMTGLFSGERVPKDHARVEAYGDVDELSSVLGVLAAALSGKEDTDRLRVVLKIQSDLFHIGALLATTPGSAIESNLEDVREDDSEFLITAMDILEKDLPGLENFILPGGSPPAAWTHVARAVCRRVERRVVSLKDETAAENSPARLKGTLVYLNRLSDYFFMLARDLNQDRGIPDTIWGNEKAGS